MASGYRRLQDIPLEILEALNKGEQETKTLIEALSIDFSLLMQVTCPFVPREELSKFQNLPITKRMKEAASILHKYGQEHHLLECMKHPSDTVRGWTAIWIGMIPNMTLEERFERLRSLADDTHFGVREWAWMAARPHIKVELLESLEFLKEWAGSPLENLRRFAIESTRPRGVWCPHLEDLKREPMLARSLLEQVFQDPSRYVQNSVANWMNDASKHHPLWVKETCDQWLQRSSSKDTAYICKRALRTLRAQNK
jgi:3-methyladenine DNA glycosylase AlkC